MDQAIKDIYSEIYYCLEKKSGQGETGALNALMCLKDEIQSLEQKLESYKKMRDELLDMNKQKDNEILELQTVTRLWVEHCLDINNGDDPTDWERVLLKKSKEALEAIESEPMKIMEGR